MQQLTPEELHVWLTDPGRVAPLLVDVREAREVEHGMIGGARHIPMANIPAALPSLPPATPIVIYCQHGIRSLQVANFLAGQGCAPVYSLTGGISAWPYELVAGAAG